MQCRGREGGRAGKEGGQVGGEGGRMGKGGREERLGRSDIKVWCHC